MPKSSAANGPSDEDDDGGVHPKEIARKKQVVDDKKKKKEESKKTKEKIFSADLDDNEDEDGGIVSTKPKVKPTTTKTKAGFSLCFRHEDDHEDEDGGVSKQKIAAAEKKKQAAEEKKKKKAQQKAIKTKVADDDDDDDDGAPKQTVSAKKAKDPPQEEVHEIEVEDEDEDGGRIVKTYDTVKTIIPSKRPVLHNQSSKTKSSADNTDEEKVKPSKREKTRAPASYDTISKLVMKPSNPTEKRKSNEPTSDFHFGPIASDEETSDGSATADSSTSDAQNTNANKVNLLRSGSYRRAQQRSPPTVTRRSAVFSSIPRQSTEDDKNSQDSEMASNQDQPAVNQLVHATVAPITA